jgi:hypothetical protein
MLKNAFSYPTATAVACFALERDFYGVSMAAMKHE